MIKSLRFYLLSMLAMLGGSVFAQDVVIDFNAMDLAVSYSANADQGIEASTAGDITESRIIEQDGVKIVISPKEEGNSSANRFWKTNNGPQLRCYSGTIAIKWKSSTIKSIVFDAPSKFNLTADKGTITNTTWSGEADEVIFVVGGNTQINKITVSATGSVTPEPEPQPGIETTGKGTLESPYTVADALAVVSAMEAGVKSTEDYYIKGKICSIKYTFSAQYGTATFNISETGQAGQDEFTCYGVYYLENKPWVDGFTQVKEGDEVIVYGKVINYKGTTPETSNKEAYIYSLNGQTKAEGGTDPQPQPEVKKITVAEALAIIDKLEPKAITEETYQIEGYVISLDEEFNPQYGNYTANIGDTQDATQTLKVYRAKNADNEKFTEDVLKVGNKILVQGKLQKYQKGEDLIPETNSAVILSIEGNSTSGIVAVGRDSSRQAAIFNLNGQRVVKAQKGLYIVNGRKYMVK